jgi:hypothetical protein
LRNISAFSESFFVQQVEPEGGSFNSFNQGGINGNGGNGGTVSSDELQLPLQMGELAGTTTAIRPVGIHVATAEMAA